MLVRMCIMATVCIATFLFAFLGNKPSPQQWFLFPRKVGLFPFAFLVLPLCTPARDIYSGGIIQCQWCYHNMLISIYAFIYSHRRFNSRPLMLWGDITMIYHNFMTADPIGISLCKCMICACCVCFVSLVCLSFLFFSNKNIFKLHCILI